MKLLQEIEQHSHEIRRLLGVPTNADVALQFTGFAASVDQQLAALVQSIALIHPPVGAILPWHKNATAPALAIPANWVECSGQTITDQTSPLFGLTIPNLNDGDFLRGNTASGGSGGATQHQHIVTGLTEQTSELVGAPVGTDNIVTLAHDHVFATTSDPETHLPPYFDVVWIIRIK